MRRILLCLIGFTLCTLAASGESEPSADIDDFLKKAHPAIVAKYWREFSPEVWRAYADSILEDYRDLERRHGPLFRGSDSILDAMPGIRSYYPTSNELIGKRLQLSQMGIQVDSNVWTLWYPYDAQDETSYRDGNQLMLKCRIAGVCERPEFATLGIRFDVDSTLGPYAVFPASRLPEVIELECVTRLEPYIVNFRRWFPDSEESAPLKLIDRQDDHQAD